MKNSVNKYRNRQLSEDIKKEIKKKEVIISKNKTVKK